MSLPKFSFSKKRIFKKLKHCLFFLLGIFCLYFLLLKYPYPFFRHQVAYKNFSIYSTTPIPLQIYPLLDEVEKTIKASEIYESGLQHRVFICNSYSLYTFFCPPRRLSFACNLQGTNNIFIACAQIAPNAAFCFDKARTKRSLRGTISHEIIHTFIRRYAGSFSAFQLSRALKEGYCELIAREEGYHYEKSVKYLKRAFSQKKKRKKMGYFEYRLIVDYLISHKKESFRELIRKPFQEGKILEEMLR